MNREDLFVASDGELLGLLDSLFEQRQGEWWDGFFSDRAKPCPFFVEYPNENLIEYFDSDNMAPGRVLELGCGHGRNALYFSRRGCVVDAVDSSKTALTWAKERAVKAETAVNSVCSSVLKFGLEPGAYDIVYGSGGFHHMPPTGGHPTYNW